MRLSLIAVLLLSSWPAYAQSQDVLAGKCKPGRYDADKGIGWQENAPECYTGEEMIRALADLRSFPVIMATDSQSKTTTRMFTFNTQTHEGYELLLNAPITACSRAKEIGVVAQCPDTERLDAFGATKAVVVDHYDQAQFMDIAARGARSFSHDANVMLRGRSLLRNQAFVVVKTYRGADSGTGFQLGHDQPLESRSAYEFIDYTADGKALLGNP